MENWTSDNWNTSIYVAGINKITPLGMYYYYVDDAEIPNLGGVIGNCNAINSCWFTPVFDLGDFDIAQVPYDVDRFGKAVGSLDTTPNVKRITGVRTHIKELGTFRKYEVNRPTHNLRDWRNESRLLNFPYSYCMISDNINVPLEVRYHEIFPYEVTSNEFKVACSSMISDKGSYNIFVRGNKGDQLGTMESLMSSSPTEIPVASSAYAQWSSTQKASTNQSLMNNLQSLSQANAFAQEGINLQRTQTGINTAIGIGGNIVSGLGNLATGNIGGALGNVFGGVQQGIQYGQQMQHLNLKSDHSHRAYALGQSQAIGSKNAMLKDLNNTPRSMMSTGSDVLFSLKNSNARIDLYRYGLTTQYKERLGDYFAMYGYKQARVMPIDLRSRRDYNYIQTVGANIQSKYNDVTIPKDHLRKLTEIFDNGVTIWHIDRNGGLFQNYKYDNVEV